MNNNSGLDYDEHSKRATRKYSTWDDVLMVFFVIALVAVTLGGILGALWMLAKLTARWFCKC